MTRWLLLLLAFLVPQASFAQALSCHADAAIALPHADEGAGRDGGRRVVPVTGYTLALAWAPEYCRTRAHSARDAVECGPGERFGFILHGLWPEGRGRDYPQYCRAVSILPSAVIRQTICMMPSAQLMQHEWTKHGSCMGTDPAAVFGEERRLFAAIHMPDMDRLSHERASGGRVAGAFAAANAGLPASAVEVIGNRSGWLTEVRICLDRAKHPQPCPGDARAQGSGGPLKIWRGEGGVARGATDGGSDRERYGRRRDWRFSRRPDRDAGE